MALGPTNNATFMQEVDDAVRQERLDSIWERFGRWIIGGVLAALVAFAGWLYWGHHQESVRGENSELFIGALDKLKAEQTGPATKELQSLASEGGSAYRAMALIEQANIKLRAGDAKGAAALMSQVAKDEKIDSSLRDMALIRQTAIEFDQLKPDVVIARMKPIVDAKDPESSWMPSAAELTAISLYQMGQYDKAGALYARIVKTKDVPESLLSRAKQMAGMLGVDTIEDRAEESAAKDAAASKAVAKTPATAENGKAK